MELLIWAWFLEIKFKFKHILRIGNEAPVQATKYNTIAFQVQNINSEI